jgi:amino-acid N-acetyltransferase
VILASAVAGFAEKDFYLEEFRGRTLVLATDREILRGEIARRRLAAVVRDLVGCGSRVVVVVGNAPEDSAPKASPSTRSEPLARWRRWLGLPRTSPRRSRRVPKAGARSDVVAWPADAGDGALADLWRILRVRSLCLVVAEGPAVDVACRIASGFRVTKLVLIDRVGGLVEKSGRRPLSYLDGASLDALLATGEAEFQGFGHRRGLLTQIDTVLERGVSSVNLCRIDGLARELFTYEGAGTFISRDDHCHVEPLAIDHFDEVERLIARGQREGLLKPRTADQIAEVLLDGFGVWVGAGHLAGVGALRAWHEGHTPVGEISALYTFTRFKGEGIGGRLVKRLLAEANAREMAYVFAVTTSDRAAKFFLRQGFAASSPESVPADKWLEYDPARRSKARVFRF